MSTYDCAVDVIFWALTGSVPAVITATMYILWKMFYAENDPQRKSIFRWMVILPGSLLTLQWLIMGVWIFVLHRVFW